MYSLLKLTEFSTGNFRPLYLPRKLYVSVIKTFQIFGITTAGILPLLCLRLWLKPCVPHAPGFWLLQQCSKVLGNETGQNYGLAGLSSNVYWASSIGLLYWSVFKIFNNHFFVVNQLCFLIAFCLRFYLNTLFANIQRSVSKEHSLRIAKFYRELQLLLCYFNKIHQDIFMFTLICFSGLANVIGLHAFITCRAEMNFDQFLNMGSAVLQSFACVVVGYGAFGGIYDDSTKTLKALRSVNIRHEFDVTNIRKTFKKSVMSLQLLKVKLGSVNFIDRLTPATLVDFFVSILVNLLLLQR